MAEEGQLAAHDHSSNAQLHRLGTIVIALVDEVRALRAQKAGSWLERDATTEEVRAQAEKLHALAVAAGLTKLQVRDDGLVVVHTDEAGYSAVARFATEASRAVGAWVRVVTDDSLTGRTRPRRRSRLGARQRDLGFTQDHLGRTARRDGSC